MASRLQRGPTSQRHRQQTSDIAHECPRRIRSAVSATPGKSPSRVVQNRVPRHSLGQSLLQTGLDAGGQRHHQCAGSAGRYDRPEPVHPAGRGQQQQCRCPPAAERAQRAGTFSGAFDVTLRFAASQLGLAGQSSVQSPILTITETGTRAPDNVELYLPPLNGTLFVHQSSLQSRQVLTSDAA